MVTTIMAYASFVLGYGLVLLLIAFGIWVYRKIELRSLPWVLAYMVLSIIFSIVFFTYIKPQFSSPPNVPHVTDFMNYIVSNGTWDAANRLLVAVLLLADCTVLIIKAGGNLTGKFARMWRWIYDKSTFFGCALIASVLIKLIWSILLWRVL